MVKRAMKAPSQCPSAPMTVQRRAAAAAARFAPAVLAQIPQPRPAVNRRGERACVGVEWPHLDGQCISTTSRPASPGRRVAISQTPSALRTARISIGCQVDRDAEPARAARRGTCRPASCPRRASRSGRTGCPPRASNQVAFAPARAVAQAGVEHRPGRRVHQAVRGGGIARGVARAGREAQRGQGRHGVVQVQGGARARHVGELVAFVGGVARAFPARPDQAAAGDQAQVLAHPHVGGKLQPQVVLAAALDEGVSGGAGIRFGVLPGLANAEQRGAEVDVAAAAELHSGLDLPRHARAEQVALVAGPERCLVAQRDALAVAGIERHGIGGRPQRGDLRQGVLDARVALQLPALLVRRPAHPARQR